jgi:hypothetical protein
MNDGVIQRKTAPAPAGDDPEGDALSDEGRAALHRSLRRSIAQSEARQLIEAEEVLAELER